ncbi:MAG: regulator of protease activity HflC (stomatin/prohibitin superfamily), partial [Patescibacteria group bacterium]
GKMTLTDANEQRDEVNGSVEKVLTRETATYGVDVLRVEIQRIEPPRDVQDAMNQVVKAEQSKIAANDLATAKETEADGDRRATIKRAEGSRQGSILEAEGKSKAFDLVNKSFKDNAQVLKRLEVTENSLKDNAKIILTEKGISPQLIIGDLPLRAKK